MADKYSYDMITAMFETFAEMLRLKEINLKLDEDKIDSILESNSIDESIGDFMAELEEFLPEHMKMYCDNDSLYYLEIKQDSTVATEAEDDE